MAEQLTKTAIKAELQRRIDWFEKAYPDIQGMDRWNMDKKNHLMAEQLGRYWAYRQMREQVENGYFLGGGV